MPKSARYIVNWSPGQEKYLLSGSGNDEECPLPEERAGWLKWIEAQHAFAFNGRNGHLNLLKERRSRGSEGYWYGYQRHAGGMVKRYIGRSAQLTIERLEEVAALLGAGDGAQHSPAPVAQTGQPSGVRHVHRRGKSLYAAGQPSNKTAKAISDTAAFSDSIQLKSSRSAANPQFEPLLMPKLQLPRLQKSLLPREHLLELLDKGLERKLTLIAGPAGYGKTTLVGQWIAERSTRTDFPRIATVTMDEGDNDPIRFWRYIIAACQQLYPGLGREALELLLAHRLPPFKPLEMMLTALLNELSQVEHPGILVLDDFHVISSPQVAETLSFLLDHLPLSFHLLMLMRGDPPFSLARLRARNELLDIYPPHLCFSLEETRTFFEQELSFTLSPKILRRIFEHMDGWPAGLRLLARELHWTDSVQDIERMLAAFAGNYWSIREYFLSEVLHTLPMEQQEFLLQTCILPRVTAPLCNAVMRREDSAHLIRALRGGDLFLIPLDVIGEWVRYHSLFAEAMQQEARRCLGEERLRQLSARASSWYEEHGLLAEAIETALNAAAFTRSASLIEQYIEDTQQGNVHTIPDIYTLNRWLERLPDKELERNPELCLHYAMTLLFIQMEGPRFSDGKERIGHLLQVAEQKWRDANNTAKLAKVFSFRALLARQDGKMLQAMTWARQALAWLPQDDHTWRNLSLTVVGVGEILGGNLTTARNFLLEALALSEKQGNLIYARATRGMLAGASLEQGELSRAAEQLRQMQAEARVQDDHDDIARTQLALARIAYQRNNLEQAEQAAHEALEIGERMNVGEFHALATVLLALIEYARNQTMPAQQRLTAWLAQSQVPTSPHRSQLAREVQATLAFFQLAEGDLSAVERWFNSTQSSEVILPLLQYQHEQLLHARLLLAQGEITTAIARLESLYTATLQTGHVYFRLGIQVVLALAYSRQGSQAKAHKHLLELLTMAHSEGYMRLFLNEGAALADVLRSFLPYLHEKVLLTCLRRILSAFSLEIGTLASQTSSGAALLQEPLSQQEQKVLRLLAVGNPNAEIARELVVSVNTVRSQLQSIYRKLNVNNRVEASAVAKQLKLV